MSNPTVLNAKTLLPAGVILAVVIIVVGLTVDRTDAFNRIENNTTATTELYENVRKVNASLTNLQIGQAVILEAVENLEDKLKGITQ